MEKADEEFRLILTEDVVQSVVNVIPEDWLQFEENVSADDNRNVYRQFLINRVNHSRAFLNEAEHARQTLV